MVLLLLLLLLFFIYGVIVIVIVFCYGFIVIVIVFCYGFIVIVIVFCYGFIVCIDQSISLIHSLGVLALWYNQFASFLALFLFMGWLPNYIDKELHFDLKQAGVVGFLPYLLLTCTQFLAGYLLRKYDFILLRVCIFIPFLFYFPCERC
jgi:hypothetical protein